MFFILIEVTTNITRHFHPYYIISSSIRIKFPLTKIVLSHLLHQWPEKSKMMADGAKCWPSNNKQIRIICNKIPPTKIYTIKWYMLKWKLTWSCRHFSTYFQTYKRASISHSTVFLTYKMCLVQARHFLASDATVKVNMINIPVYLMSLMGHIYGTWTHLGLLTGSFSAA
jgi:hypothetical protein